MHSMNSLNKHLFESYIKHYHNVKSARGRIRGTIRYKCGYCTRISITLKKRKQPEVEMDLLQEAEAVSDFIDAVVSILPCVNVDTFLPALKHQI